MNAKILIIDDEDDILEYMLRLLSRNGYESKAVHSAEEGIYLAAHEHFDIVYTDMKMPGRDGVEVCRAIKKISPDTAVVVISGSPNTMAGRQFDFLESGGIDLYLRKPVSSEEILSATVKVLSAKRQIKPS